MSIFLFWYPFWSVRVRPKSFSIASKLSNKVAGSWSVETLIQILKNSFPSKPHEGDL